MCPICASDVPVQQTQCNSCGTGLAEYAAVWYFPDQVFNDGVAALRNRRYSAAVSLFAQVCLLRDDDQEARFAWANACIALGRHDDAVEILASGLRLAQGPEAEEQYDRALLRLQHEMSLHEDKASVHVPVKASSLSHKRHRHRR